MATSSSSSSSLLLPNINFNSRQSPTITRSVSIAGIFLPRNRLSYNHNLRIRTRLIRASKDDNVAVEDRDNAVKINGDYNGSARLNGNGSARKSVNGDFNGSARLNGNGSLVKYVNGSVTVETEEVTKKRKEEVRKKRVEDIGQEDAWFKNNTQQKQVEVSVTPGGRWNRFKTYSTIQRTLEIWGFVVQFIFRTWLSNKKFSYKGGMTEEKKVLRRKVLAKWLKENILRLGPTFIKIGQQFSTRVDILPQEYVDQLSELQDQVPPFPSATALSIVEEELGGSVEDIFDRFDYEPIAAADRKSVV